MNQMHQPPMAPPPPPGQRPPMPMGAPPAPPGGGFPSEAAAALPPPPAGAGGIGPPLTVGAPPPCRPEDSAPHITVSDPVQHSEGMNKYTSYRVDVRPVEGSSSAVPPIPADSIFQSAAYSAVLRRYSDFLWLYERLHRERAGAIVPPIPEKQAVARFTPAFVEERRAALEVFLRRVSVHPELHDAPSLDTFLRADDATFYAAKSARDPAAAGAMALSSSMGPYGGGMGASSAASGAAAPKRDGLKRWFAEARTSISGDLVRSPDDDLFEEIERYVHSLDAQMRNVSAQASGLVRKGKEIANGLFEFGLAFNLLGQSEADSLGDALGRVGEAADSLSVLSAEHAERETARFEAPLRDYVKTIHAVKLALSRRHEKRLTYTTCLQEATAKNAALARLRASPGSEGKAYAAELALRRAQDAADAARDDFMTVGQRVLREVDRFKREKAEDMRRTVAEYIDLQIEHNRRMEEVWSALIPALERLGTEGPGGGGGGGGGGGAAADGGAPPTPGAEMGAAAPPGGQIPAPAPQQGMAQPLPTNPQGAAAAAAVAPPPDPAAPMGGGGGVYYRDSGPGAGGGGGGGGGGVDAPAGPAGGGGIQYRM